MHRVVELLLTEPDTATRAGDHRADDRLPDWSEAAVRDRITELRRAADALAEIDDDALTAAGRVADRVDAQLLHAAVDARLFALRDLREHEWNPLLHNPGFLIHKLLLSPLPTERLASALAGRLTAIPETLATAETVLRDCPAIHLRTAVDQAAGLGGLIGTEVRGLTAGSGYGGLVVPATAALAALDQHLAWLRDRLADTDPTGGPDPRLGRRLWEAKLWHTLDSELTGTALLERATRRLEEVTEQLTETARELGYDDVRAALDAVAADGPDDTTVVAMASAALDRATAFVRERGLVPLVDDPIEVRTMPEFARGVSVAYCDAPGPLEVPGVPTVYAIAPTPAGWPQERVRSYYREYNAAMIEDLSVHEAMPGHYLQMAHERTYERAAGGAVAGGSGGAGGAGGSGEAGGSGAVRAICGSGVFREGWAVLAEELMADAGYGGPAVRLQQLKMQLRSTLNALLDQQVHCDGMAEADALALLRGRGFQEEGEAVGKWRRALLTSTQLSTYFVGYVELADLAAARPAGVPQSQWYGRMLAHGAPPPRHLRTLLAP
jgi:uncharacterized protein (DUF885 family)